MSLFAKSNKERMEFCDGSGRFTAVLNDTKVFFFYDDQINTLKKPEEATLRQFNADIAAKVYGPI